MDIFRKRGLTTRTGFTLVEVLVTCAVMVIAFALITIVFSKVMVVRNIIHVSSNAENLTTYLMNTILHGPAVQEGSGVRGIVNYGLLNAASDRVILNAAAGWDWNSATGYGPRADFDVLRLDCTDPTVPANIRNVVFDFHPGTAYGTPYEDNTVTGQWAGIGGGTRRDLRPNWAIEKRLRVYYSAADANYTSGFWFYKEDGSPASLPGEIRWVAIRITVIEEGQQPNEGVTIWRYVRLKNQPPI